MAKKTKDSNLSIEERLEQALIPNWDEPYKVPRNWCWTMVGNVTNIYRGVSYKKHEAHAEKRGDDCLVMRGGNVQEGFIDTESDNIYVSKELVSKDQLVQKYDIIIVSSTGSTKVIGRAGISFSDYTDVAFGAFLTLVRPIEQIYKPYISYYFQGDMYRNRMRQLASGVNINNIRNEHIAETPIPLPPIDEQKRIVERIESLFAKLDEAKEKVQEVVDGFEIRKAAILHKAFSGELTAKWRKKNEIEINSWDCVTIENVCTINPKKIDTKNLLDDLEVSFFPMSALSEVYGEITDPQVKRLKEVKIGFTNFSEGDVVFAKITPCMENGKSAIIGKLVNNIGYGTTEFYVFRCGEKLYNRYLYHLVRSKMFRDKAKQVMTGAVGQQRVPKSFIEQYELKLPLVAEQMEIVRILDILVSKELKAKETAEAVIEQIGTMKKAILARAFRGELGTNDPTEESAMELLKQIL